MLPAADFGTVQDLKIAWRHGIKIRFESAFYNTMIRTINFDWIFPISDILLNIVPMKVSTFIR